LLRWARGRWRPIKATIPTPATVRSCRGAASSRTETQSQTKRHGHRNVEIRHFGITCISCSGLRYTRTPGRDTRTTPDRDTRATSERVTRATPKCDTRATPERDTRTTKKTHCRGPGTYRRADATRSGPGLHLSGPHSGHRRPFPLRYESLPTRVKAKGSDRCFAKPRAALRALRSQRRMSLYWGTQAKTLVSPLPSNIQPAATIWLRIVRLVV
jgi:hypothetical protein